LQQVASYPQVAEILLPSPVPIDSVEPSTLGRNKWGSASAAGISETRLASAARTAEQDPRYLSPRHRPQGSLAITIYEVRLIATEQQRAMCLEAAARILALAPWDEDLRAFANGLLAEVENGGQWVWQSKPAAITLAVCAVVVGLGLVVTGGLTGDVVLIVIAGLLSSAALAGVLLTFRRQSWRIAAGAAAPVIQYAGI
jgi:hypothetical protein